MTCKEDQRNTKPCRSCNTNTLEYVQLCLVAAILLPFNSFVPELWLVVTVAGRINYSKNFAMKSVTRLNWVRFIKLQSVYFPISNMNRCNSILLLQKKSKKHIKTDAI